MFPMKYMLPGVGPKLGESVAAHPSYEAENGPHARIISAGDTACTPSVRKEVASGFTNISGVSRRQTPIGPPRGECHHQNVLDSTFQGLIGGAKIPRIFVPQRAKTGLQHAACSYTGQPHAVALAESVPVRTIFLGVSFPVAMPARNRPAVRFSGPTVLFTTQWNRCCTEIGHETSSPARELKHVSRCS